MTAYTKRPGPPASASPRVQKTEPARPATTLQRAGMAGATAFITVNIWTGLPVLALWVGSQVAGGRQLTMAGVGMVVLVLAAFELAALVGLAWLNNVYDELTGRPRVERRPPWMRSMRDVAEGHISQRVGITLLERIIIVNVYVVVIGLLVWLVVFAPHVCVTYC
jgi:hypothetical protein